MLFWLVGIGATIWLLALAMIAVGVVVWAIGKTLGWWDRPDRPVGFHEWYSSLSPEERDAFKARERRLKAYSKARERQRGVCQRLMQEALDRGRPLGTLVAWGIADAEMGFTEEFGDVIGCPDEPTYDLGPWEHPTRRTGEPPPRPPRPAGIWMPPPRNRK